VGLGGQKWVAQGGWPAGGGQLRGSESPQGQLAHTHKERQRERGKRERERKRYPHAGA